MARTGRGSGRGSRWLARLAAFAFVLAAGGSAAAPVRPGAVAARSFADCQPVARPSADADGDGDGKVEEHRTTFAANCDVPDSFVDSDSMLQAGPPPGSSGTPNLPPPDQLATAGRPGCVTGPGRPIIDTALTTASASAEGAHGIEITYEYAELGGSDIIVSNGATILEFDPGDLAPGASYRWRARAGGPESNYWSAWTPWCEFTVSSEAPDFRFLGDVDLDALRELGLRPDGPYTITLSKPQQRLVSEITDIGGAQAVVTLTGVRWTDVLSQLAAEAWIRDDVAAELHDEGSARPRDGTEYWAVLDAISVELGGPSHPTLGYDRQM